VRSDELSRSALHEGRDRSLSEELDPQHLHENAIEPSVIFGTSQRRRPCSMPSDCSVATLNGDHWAKFPPFGRWRAPPSHRPTSQALRAGINTPSPIATAAVRVDPNRLLHEARAHGFSAAAAFDLAISPPIPTGLHPVVALGDADPCAPHFPRLHRLLEGPGDSEVETQSGFPCCRPACPDEPGTALSRGQLNGNSDGQPGGLAAQRQHEPGRRWNWPEKPRMGSDQRGPDVSCSNCRNSRTVE